MGETCIFVSMGRTAKEKEHGLSKQVDKSWVNQLNSCLCLERSPADFQVIYL